MWPSSHIYVISLRTKTNCVFPPPVCWEPAAAVHQREDELPRTSPLLRYTFLEYLKKRTHWTIRVVAHQVAEQPHNPTRIKTWNVAHHLLERPLGSALFVLSRASRTALTEHCVWKNIGSVTNCEVRRKSSLHQKPSCSPLSRVMSETSRCSWTTWFSLCWR